MDAGAANSSAMNMMMAAAGAAAMSGERSDHDGRSDEAGHDQQ
jgi:hypothetical protein